MTTLNDLWCVKANVYVEDPDNKEQYIEVPMFVSLQGKYQIIKFTKEIDKNLRIFETKNEAEEWCNKHNKNTIVSNGKFYVSKIADEMQEEKNE